MIEVKPKRFRAVFTTIYQAYENGTHCFADVRAEDIAPQLVNIPDGVQVGSDRHRYWIALVAMSDTRTESSRLYPAFAKMFSENPNLFQPGFHLTEIQMLELFRFYRIELMNKQASWFVTRKQHLDEFFDSNPNNLFTGCQTIPDVERRLRRIAKDQGITNLFPGVGRKVLSLLAMYLSERFELVFDEFVPADIWVQSIANTTNSLQGRGHIRNQPLEILLRPRLNQAFRTCRTDATTANAVWLLAQVACKKCHTENQQNRCPIYEFCRGPARPALHPESGKLRGGVERPFRKRGKCTN